MKGLVEKQVFLVWIGLFNQGIDTAYKPEIQISSMRTQVGGKIPYFGLISVRKTIRLTDSILEPTMDGSSDRSLAIAYLTKGLQDVDKIDGDGSGSKILLGFAFEGSSSFFVASEDVLDLADWPTTNLYIDLTAWGKAENASRSTLFKEKRLLLSAWNKVQLLV